MGYLTPPTFAVNQILTAALMNILSGDITDLDARTRPTSGGVATGQTTTSTTYADLATVGPTATIVTGTNAMVVVTAEVDTTGGGVAPRMGFAVSGASTIAATDLWGLRVDSSTVVNIQASAVILVTGLVAGSNTFTAKYRVQSGTGTYSNRGILVWAGNNLT